MMIRPVCVPCRRVFKVKRNGFAFLEGMQRESGALPGNATPEKWAPYKLWLGDLMECQGCGTQIISGFGRNAIAEHYEPDFLEHVQREGAELQINDCG